MSSTSLRLAVALAALAACSGPEPLADTRELPARTTIDFALPPNVDLGGAPSGIAVADFDGDGRADLAAAIGASGVAVALSTGGGFAPPRVTAAGNAWGPVAGDFDRDGKVDLVVMLEGGVALLPGRGDGTFAAPRPIALGHAPSAIVARDLDGDGKLDLAAADAAGGSVQVLLGNGDGTFQRAQPYASVPGGKWLFAGDVDGDGKVDLLVLTTGDGRIAPIFGNGDGTFRVGATKEVDPYGRLWAFAAGDFDGDGKLDLVCARRDMDDHFVFVTLGNGDGTFHASAGMSHWRLMPTQVMTGDIDGDGKLDVVAAVDKGRFLMTIPGKGDGKLGEPAYHPAPGALAAVADVDGDGKADVLAATSGGATLLAANGDGTLQGPCAFAIGGRAFRLATGDFDGDGVADVALTYNFDAADGIAVLLGDGRGGLRHAGGFSPGDFSPRGGITAVDVNGDGKDDIVCSSEWRVLVSNGDGSFRQTFHDWRRGGQVIAQGDFDGDGKTDLVLYSGSGLILPGKGDGTFGDARPFAVDGAIVSMAAADLDGDGRTDLAVSTSAALQLLFARPDGTFEPALRVADVPSPGALAAGDLDGDGKPDLVVAHATDTASTVLLNAGGRALRRAGELAASGKPTIVDLDGDGIPDVALPGPALAVFRGRGDGTFEAARTFAIGGAELGFGDFEHDGLTDIVVEPGWSSFVAVYRNTSRGGLLNGSLAAP